MENSTSIHGTVHGKLIELDQETGLPEGQAVAVVVVPISSDHVFGEGLRSSFGSWAEEGEELDDYLKWNRKQRKQTRWSNEV